MATFTAAHYLWTYGYTYHALQVLALAAAITGRLPVVPSVPCTSKWLERHHMSVQGVTDDYVIQLRVPRAARSGGSENGGGGGDGGGEGGEGGDQLHCHLSMGGATCTLPKVLPAWHADPALFGGLSPEEAIAAPLAWAAALLPAAAPPPPPAYRTAPPACVLSLSADLAAARRAHAGGAGGAALMLEVGDVLTMEPGTMDHLPGDVLRPPCVSDEAWSTEEVEAQLNPEEEARLRELRRACPAFFAARGTRLRHLDWIHKRRLRPKRKRKQA